MRRREGRGRGGEGGGRAPQPGDRPGGCVDTQTNREDQKGREPSCGLCREEVECGPNSRDASAARGAGAESCQRVESGSPARLSAVHLRQFVLGGRASRSRAEPDRPLLDRGAPGIVLLQVGSEAGCLA